jgi:hypothetical protein
MSTIKEKALKKLQKVAEELHEENLVDDDFTGGHVPEPEGKWLGELYEAIDILERKIIPASSPEELEVWVDNTWEGTLVELTREAVSVTGWNPKHFHYNLHHIQLINSKTGQVVMDNCQTKDQEQ